MYKIFQHFRQHMKHNVSACYQRLSVTVIGAKKSYLAKVLDRANQTRTFQLKW